MYRDWVAIVLVVVLTANGDRLLKGSIFWDSTHNAVRLLEGVLDPGSDAYGYYNDTLQTTGWGELEIRAGYGRVAQRDHVTMFTAGYLEGFLTAPEIYDHYTNMFPVMIKNQQILVKVKHFLAKQEAWSREQVRRHSTDPLWVHTGLVLAQLDGLQAGLTHWAERQGREPLSEFAVVFLNAVGDLLDLIPALVPDGYKAPPPMGHCSALIKVLPGFENLLLSHSSWFTYAATLRIYKHWSFRLDEPHTAATSLSFSSYPGLLSSLDDFYLLSSGLLMTQTTNSIFNTSLYSLVTPDSLWAWQRVRVAHVLAKSGKQWAQIFSRHNSGTYNSQYMLLDGSRVHLGRGLQDGTLTVVEQIPGLMEYSDQTDTLRRGYWPSYNVPFHPRIYERSGYPQMSRTHGLDFSYELCPRAKIFRRDQGSVTDLNTLKLLMRYNDYKNDPYSEGDPCKSICCRNDLRERDPRPSGCYDTKVTDLLMSRALEAEAVNGPTTAGGLPVFQWSRFNGTSHRGLPSSYNYSFIRTKPRLSSP